jgi:MFS family permease
VASLLGDWLNTIALYTVVERLTGSPLALGGVFLTKMLPFALASPLAGLLVDRLDRRRLMIVLDLLRAVLVLGYLWVDEASDLPLLYVLAASQMVLSAAFIPARSASIPNITSPGELLTANALMAATWSSLLALGAGLGGVLTAWLGADAVFLLDSLTYLVSAAFLWHTVIPQKTEENPGPLLATAWAGVMAGWSYVLRTPKVGRMAVVKPAWTVAGGGLVYMLTLLGPELMPAAPAMGMGFLFAARGLGTGIGPVVARSTLTNRHFWPLAFGLGIAASGLAYGSVGFLSWTFWLLPLVGFAHCFSGANWTFSTVLLQERAPDVYRGRVFATEWLLVTLMNSLSILAASLLLEYGYLTLRQGFFAFAAFMVAIGVLWLAVGAPAERRFMGAEEVG